MEPLPRARSFGGEVSVLGTIATLELGLGLPLALGGTVDVVGIRRGNPKANKIAIAAPTTPPYRMARRDGLTWGLGDGCSLPPPLSPGGGPLPSSPPLPLVGGAVADDLSGPDNSSMASVGCALGGVGSVAAPSVPAADSVGFSAGGPVTGILNLWGDSITVSVGE